MFNSLALPFSKYKALITFLPCVNQIVIHEKENITPPSNICGWEDENVAPSVVPDNRTQTLSLSGRQCTLKDRGSQLDGDRARASVPEPGCLGLNASSLRSCQEALGRATDFLTPMDTGKSGHFLTLPERLK